MSSPDFSGERQALADTGRKLLEAGLVARTWGNLSIRVSETHFLITPSGRNYEGLSARDMAVVKLEDLSWSGEMKPSSEKDLHARVYRNRPDVEALIHTHQPAASSLAAARRGFSPADSLLKEQIGGEVPCVPYALPTTRALAKAVEATLIAKGSKIRAMLLSNHGTVCVGGNLDEAFNLAMNLEAAASAYVLESFRLVSGNPSADEDDLRAGYSRNAQELRLTGEIESSLLGELERSLAGKKILISRSRWILSAAGAEKTVRPMLDDLAQLIGPSLPVVNPAGRGAAGKILKVLRKRSAVLLPGLGCLCVADNAEDAEAVSMVAEKGCRAVVETAAIGGGFNISPLESRLMRLIYLLKYSRKAA